MKIVAYIALIASASAALEGYSCDTSGNVDWNTLDSADLDETIETADDCLTWAESFLAATAEEGYDFCLRFLSNGGAFTCDFSSLATEGADIRVAHDSEGDSTAWMWLNDVMVDDDAEEEDDAEEDDDEEEELSVKMVVSTMTAAAVAMMTV